MLLENGHRIHRDHGPHRRWIGRATTGGLCTIAVAAVITAGCRLTPRVDPAEAIRLGDEHAARKNYAEAIAAYGTAIDLRPNDGKTRLKLARAYLAAGRWTDAAPQALRAAELLPNDDAAQKLGIEMLLATGRFVDAASQAAALLEQRPQDGELLALRANAVVRFNNSWSVLEKLEEAIRTGRYEAALFEVRPKVPANDVAEAGRMFRRALELAPDSPGVAMAFANFSWAVDRPADAQAALEIPSRQGDPVATRALAQHYARAGKLAEAEKYLRVAAGSGDRAAMLALADVYVKLGRHDEAIALLDAMTADDTGEAARQLATLEFRTGKHERAVSRLDERLARQPNDVKAIVLKAAFATERREWDQALTLARAALAKDPKCSQAHAVVGRALQATGDFEAALDATREAFRLNPDDDELPLQLAQLQITLGFASEAVSAARDARRRRPHDRDATLALVKALILNGNFASAEIELKPLAGADADADVLVQVGTIQSARSNGGAARAAFERALQLDPNAFDAHDGLVSLDLKDKQLATAEQRIDRLLAEHPNDVRYLLLAARTYRAVRKPERSQQALRRVLQIDSANVSAAVQLAEGLARDRLMGEARTVLSDVLSQRPRSADATLALASVLEANGKTNEARALYERVIADHPRVAKAAYKLASIIVEQQGNVDFALTLAIRAKQQLPNDPYAADALGWVYTKKKLPAMGVPQLRAAVEAVPENGLFRYHLGAAYLAAGDSTSAREQLSKALQLDPHAPYADEIISLLAADRK